MEECQRSPSSLSLSILPFRTSPLVGGDGASVRMSSEVRSCDEPQLENITSSSWSSPPPHRLPSVMIRPIASAPLKPKSFVGEVEMDVDYDDYDDEDERERETNSTSDYLLSFPSMNKNDGIVEDEEKQNEINEVIRDRREAERREENVVDVEEKKNAVVRMTTKEEEKGKREEKKSKMKNESGGGRIVNCQSDEAGMKTTSLLAKYKTTTAQIFEDINGGKTSEFANRFRIDRVLFDNCCFPVFLVGWDFLLKMPVLVKSVLLRMEEAETAKKIKALQREASILNQLDHPAIVKLVGKGLIECENSIHLISEYLGGNDLLEQLKARGCLCEEDARKVMRTALKAVEYMHSMGFVHRDMKPENLVFARVDDFSSLKIIDFGIALRIGDIQMSAPQGIISGTAGYIAPEVLNQQPYGFAVDIFALGVILYLIIIGQHPFWEVGSRQISLVLNRAGCVSFSHAIWATKSAAVKDLISQMCSSFQQFRPTANAALHHRWFTFSEGNRDKVDAIDINEFDVW